MPKPREIARTLVILLCALPALYLAAALIGSLVPANPNWRAPSHGVTIFIRSNGVHTEIVVPAAAWGSMLPARDIEEPSLAGSHLAIGWGSREFYLNTPRWRDLTAGRAAAALFGNGASLMHVDHVQRPRPDDDLRPVILTARQYRRLAQFIRGSFRFEGGATLRLHGRGYGPSDAFYEARGRYHLFRTSNVWTGEALRAAGIEIGLWTPFAQGVMLRFRPNDG